jgi:hypothetical protein
MAEPRSAVMIVAEAWWEGPDGVLQRGSVRIANKSISGVCVRVKSRIDVGAKVRIQSRWDEFSGTARYCRSDGQEYLVGIQRESGEHTIPKQIAETAPNPEGRERQESPLEERRVTAGAAEVVASKPDSEGATEVVTEVLAPKVGYRKSTQRRWRSSQYRSPRSPQRLQTRVKSPLEEMQAQVERGRITMELNWMGKAKRGGAGEDATEDASAGSGDAEEKRNVVVPAFAALPKKERVAPAVDGDLAYQNELMPLEEIYVAAGVVSPRRGYSIKKVMEMLHSEHLSALVEGDAAGGGDDGAGCGRYPRRGGVARRASTPGSDRVLRGGAEKAMRGGVGAQGRRASSTEGRTRAGTYALYGAHEADFGWDRARPGEIWQLANNDT